MPVVWQPPALLPGGFFVQTLGPWITLNSPDELVWRSLLYMMCELQYISLYCGSLVFLPNSGTVRTGLLGAI